MYMNIQYIFSIKKMLRKNFPYKDENFIFKYLEICRIDIYIIDREIF